MTCSGMWVLRTCGFTEAGMIRPTLVPWGVTRFTAVATNFQPSATSSQETRGHSFQIPKPLTITRAE